MTTQMKVEGIIENEIIKVPKTTKTTKIPKVAKTKKIEIQESPYYINGEFAEYYGAQPELIKWKDWQWV